MLITAKKWRRSYAVAGVLLLGALLAGLIFFARGCSEEGPAPLLTNDDRVSYLLSLGWEIDPEPVETLHLQLPDSLEGTEYEDYNETQLPQGFDLSPCCGKQLTRYTYAILNYPGGRTDAQLDLYLCEGTVVAGDVIALGENGFVGPLAFPEN